METSLKEFILAIVTLDANKVQGCGCPVFIVQDSGEQQKLTLSLARILGGNVHDLENGILIICKH